ncbi:uncharacterized protein LOC131000976 [Salvia miltiorrhiza]|uniref:uncharacterized protein LOC131000976 n=1 Tax=Salvia miltiorrhiza TaxID=226208 RepID=UPI0025ABFB5A|nr:uncharacterized protein LOC131000976 [Salvia miltiorrhiza]
MDSINIKMVKANAISRYRRVETLFRVVELLVVAIVVSRFSTKLSGEYFRKISVALISPRSVFLVGNAIVLVLFFKSGRFSGNDFYDEYVEKCRKNEGFHDYKAIPTKMCRSSSDKLVVHGGPELRRSMTEDCRRRRKAEEMSSEEFRRTVEAFIARQQRFLREED